MPPAPRRPDYLAGAMVLLMASIFGFNWSGLKLILPDASPFVLSAVRVGIGVLSLIPVALVLRRPLRSTPPWETFVAGMLNTGLFVILQNFALLLGGVGKTATLVYTMPLWVVLFAPRWLGEPLTPTRIAALTLGLGGLACILYPLDFQHALVGKALALLTAVLWAFGTIYTKRLRARVKFDTLVFTIWQMLYILPPLALLALIVPGGYFHPSSFAFYPLLIVTAVGGAAFAFLLWMYIMSRLSAGTAGISALLVPGVSILFAAAVIGERPTPVEILGTLLILGALAVNIAPDILEVRRGATARG